MGKRATKTGMMDNLAGGWWEDVNPNMGLAALDKFLHLGDQVITSHLRKGLRTNFFGLESPVVASRPGLHTRRCSVELCLTLVPHRSSNPGFLCLASSLVGWWPGISVVSQKDWRDVVCLALSCAPSTISNWR